MPTSSELPPPNRAARFLDALTRFVVAVLPFALGAGLIAIRLPPWFDEMAKLWGPGFIILGILVVGFIKYVPPGAIRDMIRAQEQQAEALRQISRSLEDLMGPSGTLAQLNIKLNQICWALEINPTPFQPWRQEVKS